MAKVWVDVGNGDLPNPKICERPGGCTRDGWAGVIQEGGVLLCVFCFVAAHPDAKVWSETYPDNEAGIAIDMKTDSNAVPELLDDQNDQWLGPWAPADVPLNRVPADTLFDVAVVITSSDDTIRRILVKRLNSNVVRDNRTEMVQKFRNAFNRLQNRAPKASVLIYARLV